MKMKFWFAVFVALFVAGTAQAATRTWTGGGDGTTWSDAANWGGTAPSASDAVTFPADKGCTITLPTGDLTGSGAFTVSGDYGFQAPDGQERGSATWTIGGKITLNASSSLTFKNLKVNNSTGTAWALSGDLSLVNTEMSISSSSTIDGVTVSLTDSIFTVGSSSSAKNLSFKESSSAKPTMLLVDNSTIRVSGAFPNAVSGGTVSFSGKAPRLIVRGAFKGVDSNFIHLIFNVPEDGFDYVPLTVAGSNAFPVNGFASFEVDPDSAVFASGFDGVVPLVASVYYIRNEWSGKSGSTKGATYLLPSEDFLSALAEAGGAFEYRYCTSVPTATDSVIADGVIPDSLTWSETRTESDHIDGVYIKGVSGVDELTLSGGTVTPDKNSAAVGVTLDKVGEGADSAEVSVIWGTSADALVNTNVLDAAAAAGTTCNGTISGLTPSTTYHYAFTATNGLGQIVTTTSATFMTLAGESLTLADASATAQKNSAEVSVTVSLLGEGATSADVYFAYGLSAGSLGAPELVKSGAAANETVTKQISGLTPGTEYFYEFSAQNNASPAETVNLTGRFTTLGPDPLTLSEGSATAGIRSATVSVKLDKVGEDAMVADVFVIWGTSGNALTNTNLLQASAAAGQSCGGKITGLADSTTYHYAFTAMNDLGVSATTATNSFTTPAVTAGTRTWIGSGTRQADGSLLWDDPANWEYGLVPSSGDGVLFPDGTQAEIAMPSTAVTCAGEFTMGTGCDIVLKGVSDVQYTFSGRVALPASSKLTLSGCGLYFSNGTKENYAFAGNLTVTAASDFQVGADLTFTANRIVVEKKSKFRFDKNLTFDGTMRFVLDDSELRYTGGNMQINMQGSAKIVFRGRKPFANIVVRGKDATQNTYLEFSIPSGGYDGLPFLSANDDEVPNNALIYCSIADDSPVFASDTDKVVPLISSSKGVGYGNGVDKMWLSEMANSDRTQAEWVYQTTQLSPENVESGEYSSALQDWSSASVKSSVPRYAIKTLGVYIKGAGESPVFSSFEADGRGGDSIAVAGTMGVGGSVTVQVSESADFTTVHASSDLGVVATNGTFHATFYKADTAAAEYIVPGTTYYVRAIATSLEAGDRPATTSWVATVTTAAASGVRVTGFTHEGSTVTVSGTLDPRGAGTTEVHVLWCLDNYSFDQDVLAATIGPDDPATWSTTIDMGVSGKAFCYKVFVTNECSTAAWGTRPVLGVGTEMPITEATRYVWKAKNGSWDGDWADPAHWDADVEEHHGPDPAKVASGTIAVDFTALAGHAARITLPESVSDMTYDFSKLTLPDGGYNVHFIGPEDNRITFRLPARNYVQNNIELGFEGLANVILGTDEVYLDGTDQTFVFKDTVVDMTGPKSFRMGEGGGKNHTLVIDNSVFNAAGNYRGIVLNSTNDLVVVKGADPKLYLGQLVSRLDTEDASACGRILFEIPEGGFGSVPIEGTDSRVGFNVYQNNALEQGLLRIEVDRASPALYGPVSDWEGHVLVSWPNGISDSPRLVLDQGTFDETDQPDGRLKALRIEDGTKIVTETRSGSDPCSGSVYYLL